MTEEKYLAALRNADSACAFGTYGTQRTEELIILTCTGYPQVGTDAGNRITDDYTAVLILGSREADIHPQTSIQSTSEAKRNGRKATIITKPPPRDPGPP